MTWRTIIFGWMLFNPLVQTFGAGLGIGDTLQSEFRNSVAPILVEHCIACHRPENRKGGYDLSTPDRIFKGRKEPVVVPGKPEESRLYLMLTGEETPTMPKNLPRLNKENIAAIERWIRAGARFDSVDPKMDLRKLVPVAASPKSRRNRNRGGPVTALAFSTKGDRLFAASSDSLFTFVIVPSLKLESVADADYTVYSIVPAADAKTALIAGGVPGLSGCVEQRDLPNWTSPRRLAESTDVVHSARSAADGKIAAAGMERAVRLWNKPFQADAARLEPVSDASLDLAFTADAKRLLVAGRDKTVKVWDVAIGEVEAVFSGHQDAVYGVVSIPGTDRAASIAADGSVRIWTIATAKEKASNGSFGKPITRILSDNKGKTLYLAGADGLVVAVAASNAKIERVFEGQNDWAFALALSPDGKLLAAGGWDGVIGIWETATGKSLHRLSCKQ